MSLMNIFICFTDWCVIYIYDNVPKKEVGNDIFAPLNENKIVNKDNIKG